MLDIAVAYNRYKFLGNEFLTWLWFVVANDPEQLKQVSPGLRSLEIGNRMVLENNRSQGREVITIKGDDADLEEALLSLGKGGVVTELHLVYKTAESEYSFNLKGESLGFTNLKLPETGLLEISEELEGLVLEKTYLLEKVAEFIENLNIQFLKLRLSDAWANSEVPKIKKWIG